jgi:hypothetical protein
LRSDEDVEEPSVLSPAALVRVLLLLWASPLDEFSLVSVLNPESCTNGAFVGS